MNINKVEWYSDPIIDLTEDTISSENLLIGETAHQSDGSVIIGEVSPKFSTYRTYISFADMTLAPGECKTKSFYSSRTSIDVITYCFSNMWVIEKGANSITTGAINVDCHIVQTTAVADEKNGLNRHNLVIAFKNLSNETVTFNRIYFLATVIKGLWIKAYE